MAARARFPSARRVLCTFIAMLFFALLPTPISLRLVTSSLVVMAGIMRIHTLHSRLPQLRIQLTILCSISQQLSRAMRLLWHVLGISFQLLQLHHFTP